ncbi:MAG: hypothetical protein K6C13_00715 [Oscillospiraceae bacterium]|nr:hypothetical protein [Oscillospiraceae bacterium]
MEDSERRAEAIAHLHGVSLAAAMIAGKRGSVQIQWLGLLHSNHIIAGVISKEYRSRNDLFFFAFCGGQNERDD